MKKYCIDCPRYVSGGFCAKHKKIVGALNDACDGEIKETIYKEVKEGMKICTKCKNVLPITSFSKHKCTADGLQYVCKECVAKTRRNK